MSGKCGPAGLLVEDRLLYSGSLNDCLCWSCFSWIAVLDGSCSAVHRVFGAGCCVFLPTRPPLCGWFALCVALGFLVLPLCVCVCVLRLREVCWGAWCMGECCGSRVIPGVDPSKRSAVLRLLVASLFLDMCPEGT